MVLMSFSETVTTYGEAIHGGAISMLADVAATVRRPVRRRSPGEGRGATASLTINFVRTARGTDLTATARVARRGRRLCFCEIEVASADALVSSALVTYARG